MNIKYIGLYLQKLRKNKGYTQSELAEIIGVSHQAVSRWENGENLPDVLKIKELSLLYGISVDEIIDGETKSYESKKKVDNNSDIFLINIIVSSLGLLFFNVLFFSGVRLYICYLILFSIVVGISLLYVLPYFTNNNKSRTSFEAFRKNILVTASFLLFAVHSIFIPIFFTPFIILTLVGVSLLITLIVVWMINLLLKYYEIREFEQEKITFGQHLINELPNISLSEKTNKAILFIFVTTGLVVGYINLIIYLHNEAYLFIFGFTIGVGILLLVINLFDFNPLNIAGSITVMIILFITGYYQWFSGEADVYKYLFFIERSELIERVLPYIIIGYILVFVVEIIRVGYKKIFEYNFRLLMLVLAISTISYHFLRLPWAGRVAYNNSERYEIYYYAEHSVLSIIVMITMLVLLVIRLQKSIADKKKEFK